jgi:hypothetical protein
MGGVVLGILVWQEGGEYVGLLIAVGALALYALSRWLVRRRREGKVTLLDPDLFRLPAFRVGISGQLLQNVTLGGAMIALPIFLQIKLEYDALETGLSIAPLPLTMFAVAILAGRKAGGRIVPDADSGWYLFIPLVIAGAGLGLLVSQLNNYTLAPIDDERISEAAGGELGVGVLRVVVRPRGGRRCPARVALAGVHQPLQREPGDSLHTAAADRADLGR